LSKRSWALMVNENKDPKRKKKGNQNPITGAYAT
jgi:hypothetical protein